MLISPEALRSAAAMPVFGAGFAGRDAALDTVLHDMRRLSPAEATRLSASVARPGTALMVHPGRGGGIERVEDPAALAPTAGEAPRHVTVAGGWGSALGAAALARTVADHVGAPVAAILAGPEAPALSAGVFWAAASGRGSGAGPRLAGRLRSTAALAAALSAPGGRVATLIGHAEGAAIVAAALMALFRGGISLLPFAGTDVVTLGSVVALPAETVRATQYLGGLDAPGRSLAAQGVPYIAVEGAGRSLNTALPFHLDLAALLARREG